MHIYVHIIWKTRVKDICTLVNVLISHLKLLISHLCHSAEQKVCYTIYLVAGSACSLLSVTNSLPLHSLALVWTYPSFPASSSSCCWGNKQRHRTAYSISDWSSAKTWLHARSLSQTYRKVKRSIICAAIDSTCLTFALLCPLSASDYIIKEKTVLLQKKDSEGFGFVLRGAKGKTWAHSLITVELF